jgi:hypothetical protein
MKVIVAGALASKPRNGGEAWVRMSYVLGLRRLGHQVAFVEQLDEPTPDAVDWFASVCDRFAIDGTIVDNLGRLTFGPEAEAADALINLSGNLRTKRVLDLAVRRAYVDLDPCFTQVWHASGAVSLAGHHVHFTVGENVGTQHSDVPADGVRWRRTRPPVVLDEWPASDAPFDRFTTVATWRPGHGSVTVGEQTLGLRVHAFRQLLDLPRATSLPFEAALAIHADETDDLALLEEGGWRLVAPEDVAGDPDAYRAYVAGSGAEFSVAQEAYAATRTGWIGDRTARYLASGRPALVTDTGIRSVPTGQGLVTFTTPADARSAARDLVENYDAHRAAARALAVEHFDSDRVLGRLLEDLL